MEFLPKIAESGSFLKAVLMNLETGAELSFDMVAVSNQGQFGVNFESTQIIRSPKVFFSYQGNQPETKTFTGYFDRYVAKEDVRPILNTLRSWQSLGKNRVPPLVGFEWGDNIFSPAIFQDGITYIESSFVRGIPTQLEIQFTLTKIFDSQIVK